MTYYEMNRSYRSTLEIGEFADALIGNTGTSYFPRHGKAPATHVTESAEEAVRMVEEALPGQLARYEIVGVLCRSAEEAAGVYALLKERMPEWPAVEGSVTSSGAAGGELSVSAPDDASAAEGNGKNTAGITLLDHESGRFTGRVMVTTWYLAKGLEFDAVHCLYPKSEAELLPHDRQAIYLAATRAMHELNIYYF